jgi:5'-3' exonuclease
MSKDFDLVVIDGNNMARRLQYAHSDLSINVPDGEGKVRPLPTGVPYGFVVQLVKLKKLASRIIVCWDGGRKIRADIYPAYKQHRVAPPEEAEKLYQEALALTKTLLTDLGVAQTQLKGHEADDVAYSLAKDAATSGKKAVIVSNDYDFLQAVTKNLSVYAARKGTDILYTEQSFTEEYGFHPKHWLDVMSLCGDRTDNIPGVKGVGEKSAIDIVKSDTGFVKAVCAGTAPAPSSLPKRLQTLMQKAVDAADDVRLARELARLRLLRPIKITEGALDAKKVRLTLNRLNIQSVLTDNEQWNALIN